MDSICLAYVRRVSAIVLAATFILVGCDGESPDGRAYSVSAGSATSSSEVSSEPRHRDAGPDEPHRIDLPAGDRAYASQIFETSDGLGVSWFEGEPVAEAGDGDFPDEWAGERVWSFLFAEWNGRRWTGKTDAASNPELPGRCPTHPSIVRTGPDTYFADCFPSDGAPRIPTVVRSTDGGETWERAWRGPESLLPLGPGHQKFVELVPLEEDVLALWQIRRPERLKPPASKLHATLIPGDSSISDGRPRRNAETTVLDERVSASSALAVDRTSERVFVAYRDTTEREDASLMVVRRREGGWVEPATLGGDDWQAEPCWRLGLAVDAAADTVAVAWYTHADGPGRVEVAISRDGGRTFRKPVRLADGDDEGGPRGGVDVAVDDHGVVVSWAREPAPEHRKPHAIFEHAEKRRGRFRLRHLTHDGQLAEPVDVGRTAAVASRHAPSIAIHENRLVAVWNHDGSTAELRASSYPLSTLKGKYFCPGSEWVAH